VLEDAERLIAAWNERQALRAPMIFSPTSAPPSKLAIGFYGYAVPRVGRPAALICARSIVTPTPR
jgi:hypothetical protein